MYARHRWQVATIDVLEAIFAERCEQERRYGHVNDLLEDGTGPDVQWIPAGVELGASRIQKWFRKDYETFEEEHGLPTWLHLVREEVAEAFQEDDPIRLEEELVQVAALCCSWVERLRKKS